MLRMSFAKVANSIWRNHLGLTGAAIVTEQFAISSAAINGVGIRRVWHDVTAFTGAGGMPVAEGDSAVIAAAENIDTAAILLCAVNVVWKIIVDGHVVELCGGLVVPTAPGAAAVYAYAYALVTAK